MKHSVIILAVLAALAGTAAGQWVEDGQVICNADEQQSSPTVLMNPVTYDFYVVWSDRRSGFDYDIYAQRLSRSGMPLWGENGKLICGAAGNQSNPVIKADQYGGLIILWEDYRAGASDIYAQHLTMLGDALWADNGIPVCNAAGYQDTPVFGVSTMGLSLVIWSDSRAGVGFADIYSQALDFNGVRQFNTHSGADSLNGMVVCNANGSQYGVQMAWFGTYVLLFWRDLRSGVLDIYAQRINGTTGARFWNTHSGADSLNGLVVCNATGSQTNLVAIPGANNTAMAFWSDTRNGPSNYDVYGQRLNVNGDRLWNTHSGADSLNGLAIGSATGNTGSYQLTATSSSYPTVICSWTDYRMPYYRIYAQRVDSSGQRLWNTHSGVDSLNGFPVAAPSVSITDFSAVSYGSSCLYAWSDNRGSAFTNIYGQLISSSGERLLNTYAGADSLNGKPLCDAEGSQSNAQVVTDLLDGFVVAWEDLRFLQRDIYANMYDNDGDLIGYPPDVVAAKDVPNDQGGLVVVEWARSSLDAYPDTTVDYYSVWRSITGGKGEEAGGRPVRTTVRNGKAYAWQWIADVDARYMDRYSYPVPTLCDSGPSGKVYHHFLVTAQSVNPLIYWDSEADSGYSVDNIAPTKALLLVGQLMKGPKADIRLDWNRETVSDLWRYGVYRDLTPGFTPGPGNLVCYSDDTTETDAPAAACYYKVTAFDIHGNEGAPSNEWYFDGSTAVQLSMFAAMELEDGRVSVRWRTESEESCLRWEVERSGDPNSNYQLLGTVPGQGSTTQPTDYRYDDESELEPGTYYYRLGQVDLDGGKRYFGPVSLSYQWRVPAEAGVSGARPNPFNQTTTISYQTTTSGPVSLKVYNVYGQLVRTLESGQKPAGYHRARWDGRNDRGEAVSAGVYLVRLEGQGLLRSARVAVVR